MKIASKGWLVLVSIFLVALSSSLIVMPSHAQSSTVTPTFSVQYIEENETIVFTIKNQPYTVSNGINYYFNFRYKNNYDQQWKYTQFNPNGTSVYKAGGFFTSSLSFFKSFYAASNSEYTTITFNKTVFMDYYDASVFANGYKLDFQVQAQIGTISWIEGSGSPSLGSLYKFTGESSSWSETQTLVIIADEEPSPTPTVPEFSAASLLLLLSTLPIVTVLLKRKQQRKP